MRKLALLISMTAAMFAIAATPAAAEYPHNDQDAGNWTSASIDCLNSPCEYTLAQTAQWDLRQLDGTHIMSCQLDALDGVENSGAEYIVPDLMGLSWSTNPWSDPCESVEDEWNQTTWGAELCGHGPSGEVWGRFSLRLGGDWYVMVGRVYQIDGDSLTISIGDGSWTDLASYYSPTVPVLENRLEFTLDFDQETDVNATDFPCPWDGLT